MNEPAAAAGASLLATTAALTNDSAARNQAVVALNAADSYVRNIRDENPLQVGGFSLLRIHNLGLISQKCMALSPLAPQSVPIGMNWTVSWMHVHIKGLGTERHGITAAGDQCHPGQSGYVDCPGT